MWWLGPRKRLHRHLLPNFDMKFTKSAPGRSKRLKPVVFESRRIDEMCFIYMYTLNEFHKGSFFCNKTRKPREVTI